MKRTKQKQMGVILTRLILIPAVICALTACGKNGSQRDTEASVETESSQLSETETTQSKEPESTEQESTEPKSTEQESTEQESTEPESTEPETEAIAASDQESAQAADAAAQPEPFTPVAGLSEDYADLEKRCFAYNGQIFTLGESTLQDLIDGGIPFDEKELNNIGNNVNSNYETDRYSVDINDYVKMQFSFINITDSNISEAECLLRYVRCYFIYVPQPDYEESLNEEIVSMISDAGNYVCFSFPLTLTKDQLLDNNSNATGITENNTVQYYVESEVYMGESGYTFEFNKKTDQLEDVGISWLP